MDREEGKDLCNAFSSVLTAPSPANAFCWLTIDFDFEARVKLNFRSGCKISSLMYQKHTVSRGTEYLGQGFSLLLLKKL